MALGITDDMVPFELAESHDVKTWRSFQEALVLNGIVGSNNFHVRSQTLGV